MHCTSCGQSCDEKSSRNIDGQPVCATCLYGDVEPFRIWPIGVVVNDKARAEDRDFGTTGGDVSEIRLCPSMARFMKGIEDETHLTILWYPHKARALKSVFARGWDGKKVGPFASRTPDRLTPIAVSEVELLAVNGTTLTVRGLEAIDGTPVLDAKVSMKSLE